MAEPVALTPPEWSGAPVSFASSHAALTLRLRARLSLELRLFEAKSALLGQEMAPMGRRSSLAGALRFL
jgi:hypothetical protein